MNEMTLEKAGKVVALKTIIQILPTVRFKEINARFFEVCHEVALLFAEVKIVPVITGASYEDYPPGGLHSLGFAWDFRSRDIKQPTSMWAFLISRLNKRSLNYRVLYHDTGLGYHYHIEYRFFLKDGRYNENSRLD